MSTWITDIPVNEARILIALAAALRPVGKPMWLTAALDPFIDGEKFLDKSTIVQDIDQLTDAMARAVDGELAALRRAPTVQQLQTRAHACSLSHGWWEEHDSRDATVAGAKIALMHSELSEALEAIRNHESEERIAEELADTIIRIFDFAGARGLDLQAAILAKMDKNDARPHRHGGKAL